MYSLPTLTHQALYNYELVLELRHSTVNKKIKKITFCHWYLPSLDASR